MAQVWSGINIENRRGNEIRWYSAIQSFARFQEIETLEEEIGHSDSYPEELKCMNR